MTRALQTAIAKVSVLPTEEQDRLANWLLDEIREDDLWDRKLAASSDFLYELAAEARNDQAEGRTIEIDPDRL